MKWERDDLTPEETARLRRGAAGATQERARTPRYTAGMPFRYRAEILEELEKHGVRPTPATRPELVSEFVADLYRHELRRLRDLLVRREIPKAGYSDRVIELRRKYILVSIPVRYWIESSD
jgi:hypothetical protein